MDEDIKTVFDVVTQYLRFDAKKHGLGHDFAEKHVNSLTNWELLQEISSAIEHLYGEAK